MKLLLPRAMGNLLNTYQSKAMPTQCVAFFDSLRHEVDKDLRHHNAVLRTFKRDVYVLLAYAISRTEDEERAARVMDAALEMPLQYPTHERLFRDYAYAAGVYYCVPTSQDKVLKYGRMALDEIKKCEQKNGAQWLVALMAKLYQGNGNVGKAIAMCHEGYDLAKMAQDTLGMAKTEKEKSKVESRLERMEKKDVEKVKAGISLKQLLAMRGDDKFKEYFNLAYPTFISALRQQMGRTSYKEELYCMFIALGTTNEELASIFNVARSSIVVAKYRIRKKLNLEEGVSMEDYLMNLLTKKEK